MFEYISAHPMSGVALLALIALTVFVCIKAYQSGKKRSAERDRIIAELEREKAIRNKYRNVDDNTFSTDVDDYDFVIGMCAHVQLKIEKIPDMNKAFLDLDEVKRYTYALGYVFEDSKKKLSEFFRSNGEPLLSNAKNAVNDVIKGEFAEIFNSEFDMFDENNEEVSVIESDIEAADTRFEKLMEGSKAQIYAEVAEYIRNNKSVFLEE